MRKPNNYAYTKQRNKRRNEIYEENKDNTKEQADLRKKKMIFLKTKCTVIETVRVKQQMPHS